MIALILVFALALSSTRADPDIMELMHDSGITIFSDLVKKAEMTSMLKNKGPFTVVVPTDESFGKMPTGFIEELKADTAALKDFLLFHIMDSEIFSWDGPGRPHVKTLNGHQLHLHVYAQNDFDFGKRTLHFNNANVLRPDLKASNGVIHIVNRVLRVPQGTIQEVLDKYPNLTQIRKVAHFSHASKYLNSNTARWPLTFFAPTDKAFAKMDQTYRNKVMNNPTVAEYLTYYHIHSGTITYEDIKLERIGFLLTQSFFNDIRLSHDKDGEPILNENGKIVTRDIECDNGIIQIVDHVLIPNKRPLIG